MLWQAAQQLLPADVSSSQGAGRGMSSWDSTPLSKPERGRAAAPPHGTPASLWAAPLSAQ